MGKKIIGILGILSSVFCAFNSVPREAEAAAGPVINNSFATPELVPGETWKIYIKASSSDANMKYLYATVEQAGGTGYPMSTTRIKASDQKELSGFLYLETQSAGSSMDAVKLKIVVHIRDDKGHLSDPVIFPLTFKSRGSLKAPPAGLFLEKEIGPIMIRLRSNGDSGSY